MSVVIFSQSGKLFEFSSNDLDDSIQRYHEYAGPVERRRGEEFAILQGRDDGSGDENENDNEIEEDGRLDAVAERRDEHIGNVTGSGSGSSGLAQGANGTHASGSRGKKQQWKEAQIVPSITKASLPMSASTSHTSSLSVSGSRIEKDAASGRQAEASASTVKQDLIDNTARRDRRRSGGDAGSENEFGYTPNGMAPAPTSSSTPSRFGLRAHNDNLLPPQPSLNSLFSRNPELYPSHMSHSTHASPYPPAAAARTFYQSLVKQPDGDGSAPDGSMIDWERAAQAAQLQATLQAQQAQLAYLKQQHLQQEQWMQSVGLSTSSTSASASDRSSFVADCNGNKNFGLERLSAHFGLSPTQGMNGYGGHASRNQSSEDADQSKTTMTAVDFRALSDGAGHWYSGQPAMANGKRGSDDYGLFDDVSKRLKGG